MGSKASPFLVLTLLAGIGCQPRPIGSSSTGAPPPATSSSGDVTGTVAVDGASLHFVERGAGEPIVFIHGSLVDFREWGPVADHLVEDYRTLTYSRRYNFPNANPIAGGDHSATVEADDLAALIRSRGLGPSHVVGVSYGGYTGLLLAARHPELVRSLTVVEPPLVRWLADLEGGPELATAFRTGLLVPAGTAFRNGDREGALRASLDYLVFPGAMDELPAELLDVLRANIREWEALMTSADAFPALSRADVAEFDIPLLVISGARGLAMSRLIDPALASSAQRGEHLVIPDGSHDVCSEQPGVCAAAIRRHVAR